METNQALKVLSGTCAELADDLLSQPEFFERHRAELRLADGTQLTSLMRYSGSTAAKDEAVNLRVGAMRLLRFSDRAIERECGIDRRTIPYRLAALTQSGKIPALKDRLTRLVGEVAEKSGIILADLLDKAHEGTESVELAAMIKNVGLVNLMSVEKLQLLTGQATEIVETRVRAGRDEIEAFWRESLKEATPVSIPVGSTEDSLSSQNTNNDGQTGDAGNSRVAPGLPVGPAATPRGGGAPPPGHPDTPIGQ